MNSPLLHTKTAQALESFQKAPSHAVVLIGKTGAGKQTVATQLAAQLLQTEIERLDNHAYFLLAGDTEGTISIDTILDIQHFLSRKTAVTSSSVNRVVLIANAERLTREAQNAFLKTLEEPPAGAVLILTVSDKERLLPTIMSRLSTTIEVITPETAELRAYFAATHASADIDRALLMSGGLPGLMTAILCDNQNHPLVKAADIARSILRLDTFGRLALIDTISKQRQTCLDVCFILQQMAELSLTTGSKAASTYVQWRSILDAAYDAEQSLLSQAQTKLVLSRLMLSL